jgi:DNA invertase Pin-like site-specific DNA recombinase
MHHVFAALAEKERRLIAIAQGPALQAKKAAGAALGNRTNLTSAARLGRVSQARTADQYAGAVMPIIEAVRKSGASSLADIADALNARGVRSATGGVWHRSAVRNLLARARSRERPSSL